MTREEAALSQLFVRFITSREEGFVLKGEVKLPVSKEVALAEWDTKSSLFTTALQDPVLREKCGMDKPTPATEPVILPVLSPEDVTKIHDDESVKVVVSDPKLPPPPPPPKG